MKIAVIGCGYWGNHLLRNFNQSDLWQLVAACDTDEKQLNKTKNSYPNIITSTNLDDILNIEGLDVIAISTPVFSHFQIAKKNQGPP
jgi:predicted dehydrogenase